VLFSFRGKGHELIKLKIKNLQEAFMFNKKGILEKAYGLKQEIKELEESYKELIEEAKNAGIIEEGDYKLLLERETEVLNQEKFKKKYPTQFMFGATIAATAAKKLVAPAELQKAKILTKEMKPYVQVVKVA